jgi:hypothetical protein
MKKIALFTALAATTLVSCNDDDSTTTNNLTGEFLSGSWAEIAPDANHRSIDFAGDSLTLAREDGIYFDDAYTLSGNTIYFGAEPNNEHAVQVLDSVTIKVSNIYIAGPAENGTAQTVTFKKTGVLPAN